MPQEDASSCLKIKKGAVIVLINLELSPSPICSRHHHHRRRKRVFLTRESGSGCGLFSLFFFFQASRLKGKNLRDPSQTSTMGFERKTRP